MAATELKKEEVRQAVVLADDFSTNLHPMQTLYPSALMPVFHIPLLEYLTETLVRNDIQELFLYCSNHVESLRSYVQSQNYKGLINVHLIVSDGCRSLGDALRDIDSKGIIRGDFILIRGDAFTNANLKRLLDWHRFKSKQDKGAAMTLIFRDLGSNNFPAKENKTCLIAADNSNNKVLFHQKLSEKDRKVKLELQLFLDHDCVRIHSGLLETHIYLCSASVLPLFSDNFDFQTMEDFIRGVLINEEILDSRIYWQKLDPEEYALPVTSWRDYNTLIRDILQKRGYPLTIEMMPSCMYFLYLRRCTYKHNSSILGKGCTLERDCVVCPNSNVGENTRITGSVIGEGCNLGNNVRLENSYLLGKVRIGDDCVVKNSVLFSGCELGNSVEIDGCILGPKFKLKLESVHTDSLMQIDSNDCITYISMSKAHPDTDQELPYFKYTCTNESDDDSDDPEDYSSSDEESIAEMPLTDDTHMFFTEVMESLMRGYQDKVKCENLILEINSSRYAYNVTIREVSYNVVKAVLSLPMEYLSNSGSEISSQSYQKTLKLMLEYFDMVILNYVKSYEAQTDCLRAIQDTAATLDTVSSILFVFKNLYNCDILSEEKILEWYELDDEDNNDVMQKQVRLKMKKDIQPLVRWLREAEEDSSD
ncbi:translation initiation factor eIF-2B subunit epsilon [Neodiprion virginianus]|uniref:translation initiation factor eIF-2B subunit epsilon n=1 Tax=Neodiprion virginianus TaxID=2961670 RepID=UPI001EE6D020|nr:translation initiation factor eIF-2B subunit epsilon [Neodiprion virginianus]